MLYLTATPRWSTEAGRRHDLPVTLPGVSLAFLALQGDWVPRERLCTLLWPEAAAAEAQHNLRANLYRLRALLAEWGVPESALEADRKRVRLQLPTDVAAMWAELAQAGASEARCTALLRHQEPLLAGATLAGFAALQEWVELERAALLGRWRDAVLSCLSDAALPSALVQALCDALLRADALDEAAVEHQLRALLAAGRGADARRRFETYRARLNSELGVEPAPALQALLLSRPAVDQAPAALARDAFIGRHTELQQLRAMLANGAGRVITLVGPGGVGKSRIARQLADGGAWVALADLADTEAIAPRLAAALGLTPSLQRDLMADVAAALCSHRGVIVLDNAEHLPALPSWLSLLQSDAASTTWLVTSRAPLGLAVERTYVMEGLSRPAPDEPVVDAHAAMACDAMQLLQARALAARPGLNLATSWPGALALVRATGGWPLALELAGAALAHHELADLLAELSGSMDALADGSGTRPPRHESMRACLALSWRLLGPDECAALASLSQLRGSFTRAAALAVADCDAPVLVRLLDRALLQAVGAGRFELHPLVAQYAAEQLARQPELHAAAAWRHATHFGRQLVGCAEAGVEALALGLAAVERDFENHRAAWATLVAQRDAATLGAAACAWSEFATAKGRTAAVTAMLAAALQVCSDDAAARRRLLAAAAVVHYRSGAFDAAQALAREALEAAVAAGDAVQRREMLNTLALALKELGRYTESERFAREGLERARAASVEREVASLANTCAMLAKIRGDHHAAAALYDEAIAIHRRAANHRGLATCLNNVGNVHRALGSFDAALACFEECLRVSEQQGIASTRAFALVNLAIVHLLEGRTALALGYAQRAVDEPAAELAVHLAADAVFVMAAINQRDLLRAREALAAMGRRARRTGLHAALMETVNCHAKLLAEVGDGTAALARWLYLLGHPQLPSMQRDDTLHALHRLNVDATQREHAAALAHGFELELLVDEAIAESAADAVSATA